MSCWSLQRLYFNLSSGIKPVDPLPQVKFEFARVLPVGQSGAFWLLLEARAESSRAFRADGKQEEVTTKILNRNNLVVLRKAIEPWLAEVGVDTSLWLLISREPVGECRPPVEGRKLPELSFLAPLSEQLKKEAEKRKFLEMGSLLRERHEWVMELFRGQDSPSARSHHVSEYFFEAMAYYMARNLADDLWENHQTEKSLPAQPAVAAASATRKDWSERVRLDVLEVHVGRGLLSLVDPNQGAPLLARVDGVRSQVLHHLGILLPGVRFCDDLKLGQWEYVVCLRGQKVATGQLKPGQSLCIGPLHKLDAVVKATKNGEVHPDPVFAMSSCWTDQNELSQAQGCMLFSPTEVLGCHLVDVVSQYACEIFDFDDFEGMMELHRANHPRLHRELDRKGVDRVRIWRVLGELLMERVSIRDLSRILQTILLSGDASHEQLVEACRRSLWRELTRRHAQGGTDIEVVGLSEEQEAQLLSGDPQLMFELGQHLATLLQEPTDRGRGLVFLCAPEVRRPLRDLLRPSLPRASFLSTEEVDVNELLEVVQFSRDATTCQPDPEVPPVGWKSRLAQVGFALREWLVGKEAA